MYGYPYGYGYGYAPYGGFAPFGAFGYGGFPAGYGYSSAGVVSSAAAGAGAGAGADSACPAPPAERDESTLVLFDVDGTLTPARQKSTAEMRTFLHQLRKRVVVGIVGGSDFGKIKEQIGDDILDSFDYVFGENGLTAYKGSEQLGDDSFLAYLGEERMQELINFVLAYVAKLDIPVKRGTFVEWRNGMINVSPIGRDCSQAEREAFNEFDKGAGVRVAMKKAIEDKFGDAFGIQVSIGGQISMDVFPKGWTKVYCLRYLDAFDTIHFFGDKTYPGGNDYEIFECDRTIGHTVTSPDDTRAQCEELFF
ncbi:phosphomannomutase 2 [Thecamonas trahens ATCC 50062]|uniref:Phosphomannomutase n=1 Tax=Thecamonas trahens ATCC 50062 TaxID=461836 RepID=A0A0L0DMN4_THETB|nr:phosphomannomutase 2 [Thecamonas trahens ATCC 50062]KNC52663.1 phosphomannomutase 2 [Thecamonas trahens ATCC 50062]|eukprot:XP_013755213.1 phosphomannomutase 2 [Thecamonas trahens ATCC 50062]